MMPRTRESISLAMRFHILRRDKFTCQYCGARSPDAALHIEHITPVVKGGTNDPNNLCAACIRCNVGKGTGHRDTDEERPPTAREGELEWDLEQTKRKIAELAVVLFASDAWPAEFRLLLVMLAADDGATQDPSAFADLVRIPPEQGRAYMRGLDACGMLWRPLAGTEFKTKFFLLLRSRDGVHRHPIDLTRFGSFRAFPSAEVVHG